MEWKGKRDSGRPGSASATVEKGKISTPTATEGVMESSREEGAGGAGRKSQKWKNGRANQGGASPRGRTKIGNVAPDREEVRALGTTSSGWNKT